MSASFFARDQPEGLRNFPPLPPHPEEPERSEGVSKDGRESEPAAMVRDASLRDAPHHEAERLSNAWRGCASHLNAEACIHPPHPEEPAVRRASRRMAASPNLLPWFETRRCATLLTMRPSCACYGDAPHHEAEGVSAPGGGRDLGQKTQ